MVSLTSSARHRRVLLRAISNAPTCAKNRILTRNAPRSAREFFVEGRNTGGGGREAARSAASDADDAQGISWRFFKHLYLLPRLINNFVRPFHVASSAPLHPLLAIQAPLLLKQRIFVRRATIFSLQMRSPLRLLAALRQRIAVRRARPFFALLSTYRRRATLDPFSATPKSPPRPLATPSILVSNFNMSRARSEPRPPFAIVADVERPSSVLFSTLFSHWGEG
ncbi:hypothetical protein EV715DRAFT_298290 [Schizophyllum commune]